MRQPVQTLAMIFSAALIFNRFRGDSAAILLRSALRFQLSRFYCDLKSRRLQLMIWGMLKLKLLLKLLVLNKNVPYSNRPVQIWGVFGWQDPFELRKIMAIFYSSSFFFDLQLSFFADSPSRCLLDATSDCK